MVNNRWKGRFEEVVHETNNLESPDLSRKRQLALILLKHLEEELQKHEYKDWDTTSFSFDDEIFREIFNDPKSYY